MSHGRAEKEVIPFRSKFVREIIGSNEGPLLLGQRNERACKCVGGSNQEESKGSVQLLGDCGFFSPIQRTGLCL